MRKTSGTSAAKRDREFFFDDRTRPEEFPLGMIEGGEPDANAEGVLAVRRRSNPLYIDGYITPPNFDLKGYVLGEKHIILGQKGTGKTALLRNIEHKLRGDGYETEYLIFRDTILEEGELGSGLILGARR